MAQASTLVKPKIWTGMAALMLCMSSNAYAQSDQAVIADVIYTGKNIVTMDEANKGATAVAVADGKIIAVGSRSELKKYRGDGSKFVELGDKALLPGFIDAHGHFTFQASLATAANLSSPPVGGVNNIEELKAALKAHIAKYKIPKGQWVFGYGYDESLLKEGRHPTRDDLDAVSTDNPIYLLHVSGHLGTSNSNALALAKLGPDSENPEGGVIRRKADGKTPDGVLEERAQYAVQKLLPQPTPEQALVGVKLAQKLYARYGVTTVQDGAASLPAIGLLRLANQKKMLDLDIVSYMHMKTPDQKLPPAAVFGKYNDRIKLGGVKLVLDGSPQGKTAFLSKPFHVVPEGQKKDYRGYANYPTDKAHAMINTVLDLKVPLIAHANGDAMAEILVDGVEAAHKEGREGAGRTVMIHAQTVREDQLDRMAKLKMIPSFFSSHVFFWGDYHRDSVLGPVRGARISPTKSALERKMTFTTHNDAPIVPPDMIRLLWATSHRETRSGKILGADQRISIYDALKTMTVNAAYQYFEEDRKGTISAGKQADFVILSQNPLSMNSSDLLDLKIEQTISRGKTVFRRSK